MAVEVADGAEAVPEGAAGEDAGGAAGEDAGGAATGDDAGGVVATVLPEGAASMAFCWATHVVAAMGQPTPSPFKFWRVTAAALKRVSIDALELSVGNEKGTDGLLMTFPALMLFARSCERFGVNYCTINSVNFQHIPG